MDNKYIPYLTPQAFRCRSMLEAFRLGIVPYGYVMEFTFGRDPEINMIEKWLTSNDNKGTLLVTGEYGQGKSHILDYIRFSALNQGYAVAMATLDYNESPPWRPKAVFCKLIRSLCYKENGSSKDIQQFLRSFVMKALKNQQGLKGWMANATRYLSTHNEEYEEVFWKWLYGYGYMYPTLYDHGTAANIYSNILSGLGCIARKVLDLKGLVVILDEAENVEETKDYWYQMDKGFNFLKGLILVSSNDSNLLSERVRRDKYQFGIGTWFGDKTNLIYHGHNKDIRYCHALPSFLKIAIAFTSEEVDIKLSWPQPVPRHKVRLEDISEAALKETFNKICLLYDSAYDFPKAISDINDCYEIVRDRTKTGIRSFIKGAVEIHDIRRFNPDLSLKQIV